MCFRRNLSPASRSIERGLLAIALAAALTAISVSVAALAIYGLARLFF
jgi:hypothetical protein